MNTTRLKQAIKFLKKIPASQFDMQDWRKDKTNLEHECNSVGCAIGHLTGMMNKQEFESILTHDFFDNTLSIDFEKVSVVLFDLDPDELVWDFMFSWQWKITKRGNSKKQLLKRMQYVVENEGRPKGWFHNYTFYL